MRKRANVVDMEHLTNLAKRALASPEILRLIGLLKKEVLEGEDPFVWRVLSEKVIKETFPEGILSGWIFVLKPNTCSPCHQHPNSVQHSVIIEGGGKIRIGKEEKEIQVSGLRGKQPVWYVIPKNVPHTVATRRRLNVVLSFHTCPSNELLEVETSSGRSRLYERYSVLAEHRIGTTLNFDAPTHSRSLLPPST